MEKWTVVIHEERHVGVEVAADTELEAWRKAKEAVAAGSGKKGEWHRTPVSTIKR